jgi:xylan 1,4-beta-xylosidase
MTYQINYANGAKVDVPIKVGESVMGILKPVEATDAVMVKEWFSGTITYRLYLLEWENPYPEETIAGIDIVSSGSASVPIIVGLGTFTGMKEAMPKDSRIDRTIYLTADFRQVKGKIDPRLFGTNDTEALVSSPLKDGDYQNYMAKIAPSLVRLHLSGRMEAIFPTKESEPNYEDITVGMDRTFDRDDRQGQRILFCFAQAPAWVDLTKEEDRKLYAQKVAQMADYLVNKKKYPIDYWQVFNEPYGRGVAEDRSVWLFYNEVAPLLKKVTPHVQVGGPVLNYPDVGIIKDFLKYCAPNVDFISWHKYPTGSVDTPTQLLMARTGEFGHDSLAVREAARQFIADRDIEMSLTEYNMNYDWRPYHDPRRATNVGAVWMASVLKHLADVDHEIALTWHSKGGGTFGLISADNEVRPTADLLMLLNKHLAGAERIASRSSDEFVEILAAQNQEQYCILVINKSADEQVVKLTTLNGPKAESDPFSRQVLNYEISGAQTNYEQGNISFFSSAISGSLTMSPYSVQLLVFNRN